MGHARQPAGGGPLEAVGQNSRNALNLHRSSRAGGHGPLGSLPRFRTPGRTRCCSQVGLPPRFEMKNFFRGGKLRQEQSRSGYPNSLLDLYRQSRQPFTVRPMVFQEQAALCWRPLIEYWFPPAGFGMRWTTGRCRLPKVGRRCGASCNAPAPGLRAGAYRAGRPTVGVPTWSDHPGITGR